MRYLKGAILALLGLSLVGCGTTSVLYTLNSQLRSVDDDGANDRQVTSDGRQGAWKSGRNEAVIVRNRLTPDGCGSTGLFTIGASGGAAASLSGQRCTPGVVNCDIVEPDVASSGEIAATQVPWGGGSPCETTFGSKIITMNASGTGLRLVTGGTPGIHRYPGWSPDGSAIVFENGRAPASNVFTVDKSGTNACQVTTEGGWEPVWGTLQGGDAIAFVSTSSGNPDIFIATPTSAANCPSYQIRQVTQTEEAESSPAWLGSALLVVRQSSGSFELLLIDPRNGAVVDTLVSKNDSISYVDW